MPPYVKKFDTSTAEGRTAKSASYREAQARRLAPCALMIGWHMEVRETAWLNTEYTAIMLAAALPALAETTMMLYGAEAPATHSRCPGVTALRNGRKKSKGTVAARRAARRRYVKRKKATDPEWRRRHNRISERARRRKKYAAGGSHNDKQLRELLHEQNGRCYWCATEIASGYEADHFIPLARGGSDGIENIVLACQPCNQAKGVMMPEEFERLCRKRVGT